MHTENPAYAQPRSLTRRVAAWQPVTAAAVIVAVGLVVHEIAYHLTGGDDFPLAVLAGDSRVFVISHGGLDSLAVGVLVVSVLMLIDTARLATPR
ncbi:MAG: hypothetical protein WKF48_05815 [Solirubrobacteraceae bacterium]